MISLYLNPYVQIGGGARFVGWGRIKKEKRKKEIQGGKKEKINISYTRSDG